MSLQLARVREFEKVLNEDQINLASLRKLSFNGIPDVKGLRAAVWKILLSYIPLQKNHRDDVLLIRRKQYQKYVDEIIVSPDENDHPLNSAPNSSWQNYFRDNDVILQIHKDVRRLCPDMSFFQSPTEFPNKVIVDSKGANKLHHRVQQKALQCEEKDNSPQKKATKSTGGGDADSHVPLPEGSEAHWEVVERILFVFAKLNPGQGYVQGMNEIIGPLYHTFAVDPTLEARKYAEADCFFCFTSLMSEIRDFFIRTMDQAEGGINSMMRRLTISLGRNDQEIYNLFQQQELKPEYYSFRWLTLLLCQEFPLPDVVRIWDSLLSDANRFQFLINICCAMIILVKDQIMKNDFASNVKLLQNYPPLDINQILTKATQIL